MVRIKMLRNKMGSPEGWSVAHYEKDTEYDVTESLAKVFIEEGVAEAIEQEKAIEAAPKNKAEKVAKNKASEETDA